MNLLAGPLVVCRYRDPENAIISDVNGFENMYTYIVSESTVNMKVENNTQGAVEETKLLDPTGSVSVEEEQIANRVDSLEGKTVGFLFNGKAGGDVVLDTIAENFLEEYGAAEVIHRQKPTTAASAGPIIPELHAECDAIVNALGDCGSCTSWCNTDSVDIELKGTPTATVNSDEFVKLGQAEAQSLGLPGLPIITVPHPMGDIPAEEAKERALDNTSEVAAALTTSRAELEEEYRDKYISKDAEPTGKDFACPL